MTEKLSGSWIADHIRWYKSILFTCLIAILLIVIHLKLREYAFDDAYIHFRIVDHLVQYGVPYFNLGEPVMASSSAGWTILLGLLAGIFKLLGVPASLPVLAAVLNGLASAAGAYAFTLLFDLIFEKRQPSWVRIIFFLTYLGMILPVSIGLMETPIVMLLVGVSLVLLLKKSHWSLACIGALPFFRLELIVMTCLAMIIIIVTKRFSVEKTLLYTALGVTPFMVFELYFFNTLIPNSAVAKSVVYTLTYLDSFRYFIAKIFNDLTLITTLFNISLMQKLYYAGYFIWVVTSLLLFFIYRTTIHYIKSKELKDKELLSVLLLACSVTIVSLYLYKRVLIFSWYEPLYKVPLLLILGKTAIDTHPRWASVTALILLLPLVLGQLSGGILVGMGAFVNHHYVPEFLSSARVRNYTRIGTELYIKYPEAKLMTSEIGGLGYSFKGYIYDGAGLVTPEALKYHPLANAGAVGGIPAGLVAEKKPELIVSYDAFIQNLQDSGVLEAYEHYKYPYLLNDDMKDVSDPRIFEGEGLNVYVRKDLIP